MGRVGLLFEPPFGVNGSHTAGAGGRHRLAIGKVLHIAGRKNARHAGVGRAGLRQDVALWIEVELPDEQGRIRLVADSNEQPVAFVVKDFVVRRFRNRRPVTPVSRCPWTSSTTVSQRKVILGLAKARACMIFEARSSRRR